MQGKYYCAKHLFCTTTYENFVGVKQLKPWTTVYQDCARNRGSVHCPGIQWSMGRVRWYGNPSPTAWTTAYSRLSLMKCYEKRSASKGREIGEEAGAGEVKGAGGNGPASGRASGGSSNGYYSTRKVASISIILEK